MYWFKLKITLFVMFDGSIQNKLTDIRENLLCKQSDVNEWVKYIRGL